MSDEILSHAGSTPLCRAATLEDAPGIARVIVAAWRLAYADLVPKSFLSVLLRCAEVALLDLRFSEATLWVLSGNLRAQRFYSAAGWRADGEQRTTTHLTGVPLHELRFRTEVPRGTSGLSKAWQSEQ